MFEDDAWRYGQHALGCRNGAQAALQKARDLRWHSRWLLAVVSRETMNEETDKIFEWYVAAVHAYDAAAEKLKATYAALTACWQQNGIPPDPDIDLPIFTSFSTNSSDFFL